MNIKCYFNIKNMVLCPSCRRILKNLDSVLSRQDEMDPLERHAAEVGASLSDAQLCNYCLIRRHLLTD